MTDSLCDLPKMVFEYSLSRKRPVQTNNDHRDDPPLTTEIAEADFRHFISTPELRQHNTKSQHNIHQREEYFAYAVDGIFVVQLDGPAAAAKPAAGEMGGYTEDQLLSMHPWDVIGSKSQEEVLEWLQQLKPGVPVRVQCSYERHSGEHLELDLRLTKFESSGRDLVIVSCRDVTETKRLEEQLRQSESRLAEGQRLTKTGSWVMNLRTARLQGSTEFYRMFGFPESTSSLHHNELMTRLEPEDRKQFDRILNDTSLWDKTLSRQFKFTLPDGTMKHGEAISQPVYNVSGVIEQRVGTVMDVTERHNAEADLRASEALARGQMQALTRTLDAMAHESAPNRSMDHVLSTIMEQLDAYTVAVWQKDGEDGLAGFECSCDNSVLQSQSGRSTLHIMSRQNNFVWQQMSHTPRIIIFEDLTQVQETRVPMRHYLIDQGVVTASRSTAFDDVVQSQKVSVPILKYLTAQGIVTLLLVPLLLAGELMGWMGVRFKDRRSFREEELQLVLALANQTTLAIQVIRLSEQARQAAIESERNRLARDMHDTLAQGFTGVIVQLEAAEDAIVQGLTRAADQHISQAGEMARYGLTEARRSVQALRPRLLEENDLCTALKKMIQRTATGTGLQANLTVKGQPQPLPSHWDEHVLRISQEVLTNTLRHAQAGNFMASKIG